MPPKVNLGFSRTEIVSFAKAITLEMAKPEFVEQVRIAAIRSPLPQSDDEVMDRCEEVQADYFANRYNAENGKPNGKPIHGAKVIEAMKNAVQVYPDAAMEEVITDMCNATERILLYTLSNTPELKHLMTDEVQQYMAQQQLQQHHHNHNHNHSHCEHNHNHNHGHGHGHGDAAHQPTLMPPHVQQMLNMAITTLSPEQRATLERVQRGMMQGEPPKPEDRQAMMLIQQHISAFMQTMGQFATGNAPEQPTIANTSSNANAPQSAPSPSSSAPESAPESKSSEASFQE